MIYWLFAPSISWTSDRESQPRVRIFYQDEPLTPLAKAMEGKLTEAGYAASSEMSPMRQFPPWANSVRYFHSDDAGLAATVSAVVRENPDGSTLKILDLTDAFRNSKVRHGSIEIWLCDQERNGKIPPAPYEKKLSLSASGGFEVPTPPGPVSTEVIDRDDPYCRGWPMHERATFLDRQRGESYQSDSGNPSKAEFVF